MLEYLEGETLARRLERGAMPTQELLKIATQVSDALDKAHRQGVIHRDLKPANIMLVKSGAKLLDFGLAKAGATPAPAREVSSLATLSKPFTAEGSIIGTIPYMAPEQLEGKEADVRTDIFALGALLYEMTTGRRAFEGNSQASLIAAILEKEPTPISELQPMSPARLGQVIKTCLAKDPEDRWQGARDVKLQLRWIAVTSSPDRAANERRGRNRLAWALAGALAIISLSLVVMRWLSPPYEARALRAFIVPPENATFSDDAASVAVSPDGTRIVFVAQGAVNNSQLWIRPLDSTSAKALPGTESAAYPFWSPDGQWIAFFMSGKTAQVARKRRDCNDLM